MCSISAFAIPENQPAIELDMAWDNHYISQGRDNLDKGGIVWGTVSVEKEDLVAYVLVGRAEQVHYIEWNVGVEYTFHLHDEVDATLGYQRLEFYGDQRGSDNEFFSSLTYNGIHWLVPAINYIFATESSGYFVEVSLHSPWEINQHLTLTPYVIQGFDFGYISDAHNGVNNVQFGLEAQHQITNQLAIATHLSHSIALEDIKQQASAEKQQGSLDETYGGVHIHWAF